MDTTLEFVKGDGNTHTFTMPAFSWTPGGTLLFAAKPAIDDNNLDTSAVIRGVFDDSVVTETVKDMIINNVVYKDTVFKRYTCYFPPSATNDIPSDGADYADYLGEFQWVSPDGVPFSVPATGPKIPVVLWFDINRKAGA